MGSKLRAMRAETTHKLSSYVRSGGILFATADALESPILGVSAASCTASLQENTTIRLTSLQTGLSSTLVEMMPLRVCALATPADAQHIATAAGSGQVRDGWRAPLRTLLSAHSFSLHKLRQ